MSPCRIIPSAPVSRVWVSLSSRVQRAAPLVQPWSKGEARTWACRRPRAEPASFRVEQSFLRAGACPRLPHGDGPSSRSRPGCGSALRPRGPPLCPSRMLVRPDDGPIDEVDGPVHLPRRVGAGLDRGEHAVPHTGEAPAAEATVQRRPRPVPRRDVAPGYARGQLPKDPVEDGAMVVIGPAGPGPRRGQQRRQLCPLGVGEFMSLHNIILPRRSLFAHAP